MLEPGKGVMELPAQASNVSVFSWLPLLIRSHREVVSSELRVHYLQPATEPSLAHGTCT